MAQKNQNERSGKGRMAASQAGHLGGEKGGHKGGQRVRELTRKGEELERGER